MDRGLAPTGIEASLGINHLDKDTTLEETLDLGDSTRIGAIAETDKDSLEIDIETSPGIDYNKEVGPRIDTRLRDAPEIDTKIEDSLGISTKVGTHLMGDSRLGVPLEIGTRIEVDLATSSEVGTRLETSPTRMVDILGIEDTGLRTPWCAETATVQIMYCYNVPIAMSSIT